MASKVKSRNVFSDIGAGKSQFGQNVTKLRKIKINRKKIKINRKKQEGWRVLLDRFQAPKSVFYSIFRERDK